LPGSPALTGTAPRDGSSGRGGADEAGLVGDDDKLGAGTHQGLEARACPDDFPLSDQELLVRHFHKTVADWVAGHQDVKA
jgi:hypothetical protein